MPTLTFLGLWWLSILPLIEHFYLNFEKSDTIRFIFIFSNKIHSCQQQLWSWRWWLSFDISFGESLKYRIDYLHCGGWWWPHKIYWSGFVFNNTSLDRIQQLIHISAGKLLLGKWIVNTLGTYTQSFLKRTISPTSWMVQNGWRGQ